MRERVGGNNVDGLRESSADFIRWMGAMRCARGVFFLLAQYLAVGLSRRCGWCTKKGAAQTGQTNGSSGAGGQAKDYTSVAANV